MAERKQVLYDLRYTYSGPFVVEELFAEIDNWIREKGFDQEPKKKLEHVTKNGVNIELITQIHSHLDELHHGLIIVRLLMHNIKEDAIKKKGKKFNINHGEVFVNIDGMVQSHIHGSFWQVKPVYYFIRSLIDQYIWNFWSFKWDSKVNTDCHDLFKRIKTYFDMQKYKHE